MARLYISNKDESARIFKSDFMEFFTKVHFSVPLFIFVPVVAYCVYQCVTYTGFIWYQAIAYFAAGLIFWTMTEYVMHRYVFHFHPKSEMGKRFMFIIHGVHHDYPNDSKRLVLPPSLSVPLAIGFFFLYKAILPLAALYPFFGGFVLGYLMYDMMHYAFHHVDIKNKYWVALKTHHLKHHFKDPDMGFGVSNTIWDQLLGSTFAKSKSKKTKNQKETHTAMAKH